MKLHVSVLTSENVKYEYLWCGIDILGGKPVVSWKITRGLLTIDVKCNQCASDEAKIEDLENIFNDNRIHINVDIQ